MRKQYSFKSNIAPDVKKIIPRKNIIGLKATHNSLYLGRLRIVPCLVLVFGMNKHATKKSRNAVHLFSHTSHGVSQVNLCALHLRKWHSRHLTTWKRAQGHSTLQRLSYFGKAPNIKLVLAHHQNISWNSNVTFFPDQTFCKTLLKKRDKRMAEYTVPLWARPFLQAIRVFKCPELPGLL